jgi:hypothetical protein
MGVLFFASVELVDLHQTHKSNTNRQNFHAICLANLRGHAREKEERGEKRSQVQALDLGSSYSTSILTVGYMQAMTERAHRRSVCGAKTSGV